MANLVDSMMDEFRFMEKQRVPDGAGGFTSIWIEGEKFTAAIVRDTTMTARVAEKDGMKSVWTITTKRNITLDYHDVIKRISDGKVFRITSDNSGKKSPSVGTLDMAQSTAEVWDLTA